MNDSNTDKQYLLDLLVDGELGDDQRRELLGWCEREPDGWRRCALAFLEAQDWSRVLGALSAQAPRAADRPVETLSTVGDGDASQQTSAPLLARPQSYGQVRQWGTMLAMAASVALAFSLGLWLRDAGKTGPLDEAGSADVRVVGNQQSPVPVRSGHPEQGPANAALAVGGLPGAADEIQLPVMEADELNGDWLLTQPAAMPEEVRQALERMGHRVDQRRKLVPYRLDDGRRVVVPVDQVEVHPVKNQSYQ
jgi:pyruvate/2-oxoglutarate dehydrogenase complex dihydrolipoamide acyltransferase (E2) component